MIILGLRGLIGFPWNVWCVSFGLLLQGEVSALRKPHSGQVDTRNHMRRMKSHERGRDMSGSFIREEERVEEWCPVRRARGKLLWTVFSRYPWVKKETLVCIQAMPFSVSLSNDGIFIFLTSNCYSCCSLLVFLNCLLRLTSWSACDLRCASFTYSCQQITEAYLQMR